jgi:predicted nucleic acid-binding protein
VIYLDANVIIRFVESNELRLIEIDARVIDEATSIRAAFGLKSPDALHLAAAVVAGASVFLTGYAQLARFNRMSVEII